MLRELGRAAAGAWCALVLVAAGCGGNGSDGAEDGITPVTADDPAGTRGPEASVESQTTQKSDDDIAADVEAAYRSAIQAFNEAAAAPVNPDSPELERWYTGRELDHARALVGELRESGQSVRLSPDGVLIEILKVEVDERSATADLCLTDGRVVHETASGRVVNDAVGTYLETAKFVLGSDNWRVESRDNEATQEAPCA